MATDRTALVNEIFYQELGRLEADPQGLAYWNSRDDLSDEDLRKQIRGAGLGPGAGPSVKAPLLADQSYAAFMRKMKFDESQIQSSLQAAQEAARRRITGQAGIFDKQQQTGERNINSSFEGRQNRSGGRLSRIGESDAAVGRSRTEFGNQIGEATAQMERDAASSIASLRREDAEQQLGARDRLTQRSAQF